MSVIGNQWQCARWSKLSSVILVLIFRVNRVSVYIDLRINPAESPIGASYCWTQHPETMKDNELIRSAPPIPPRRIKRKTKPFLDPTACSSSSATTPVFLSERRVRLPPPPPPPRGSLLRGIRETLTRSSSPGNGEKQRIAEAEARQQLSTFGSALCLPLARGNSPKKVLASQGSPRRRTKDKAKVSRPNEYPPLFFTIQDFQEVMADVEGSYNRTLRNMTTFEPTSRPRDISFGGSSDGGSLQEDQVLFRVTTTSVPFERCRGSTWGETGNDPNHFIFEDYVDRRQIRKPPTTRLILFGDDTFDHDEEDEERSTSTCSRTPSRVRFLIDSPDEIDAGKVTEFDSLHNVESLPPDDVAPISESDLVKDEFGDVPFDSILSVGPSEDSTNSSNTDFQTILVRADVEKVPAESASRDREDETPRRRTDESAPENIGRSSFLMDMLREREDSKEWSACKVVATHPKGLIPGCRIDGDEVRASVAIEAKSRLLGELSSSFSGIRLKQRAEALLGSNDEGDKERAGSLKIDLKEEEEDADGRSSVTSNCNLDSVIDSKVVKCNVREQEPIEEESRVVIPRSEPRNSSNYDCSQKTDQPIDIKYVDNITVREGDKKQAAEEEVLESAEVASEERKNMAEEYKDNDDDGSSDVTNNNNGNKVELAPRISVDKCAIVLKCNNNINNNNNNININNNNNNNNNDNNAMTPVDLSTDQSKKVLSIIPGSVRSFVKFYEIQGETSIGFNVSENYKDASDYVLPKITVEEFGKTTEIESSGENTSSENLVETPVKPIQIEIENDVKYTIVTRKQMRKDQYNGPAQRDQKPTNVNQPVENVFDKSNKPILVETATLRQTGLPLVKLCEIDEERGEKSGTRSSGYSEKPAERVAQETRNVAPRISPENQGSPTSRETPNLASSGTTTQSVPKSSATTINERYTFYCTV